MRQDRLLKRILPVLMKEFPQHSARAVSYFAAAITVYVIAGGDITSVAAVSPILAQIIERIGGDVLADLLGRVASGRETPSPSEMRQIAEDAAVGAQPNDVLTESEFYRATRVLQQRDEERHQRLMQSVAIVLSLLRKVHPVDPCPLSPVPRSTRALLTTSPLVGRETDLAWLHETEDDRLIVGQPGIGKTFLLYQLVVEGEALFVVSRDRGVLASALLQDRPAAVIVDNAHADVDLLLDLIQLRQEIGLGFDILASSWPGDRKIVADALGLGQSHIHELGRLHADQIVEVIKNTGLTGPISWIREIREQADGRPGLAVTLALMYLNGGGEDVWGGNVLTRTLLGLEPLREHLGRIIVGAFSLGGEVGMPHRRIAETLELSPIVLMQQLSSFADAGILLELDEDRLSVQPPALRQALVRDVLFKNAVGKHYVPLLLQHAPSAEEASLTLIGAEARGADIPPELMRDYLEKADSVAAWMRYAALGKPQKQWVLEHYPEKIIHRSSSSLRLVPEVLVPFMLNEAIGDDRPLPKNPSHPMRLIQEWVQSAYPGTSTVLERRELLLHKTLQWLEGNGDANVALRAFQIVMSPLYHNAEPDPGTGKSWILGRGIVTIGNLHRIKELWPSVYAGLEGVSITSVGPIREMVSHWAYPGIAAPGGNVSPEKAQFMRLVTEEMIQDIVSLTKDRLGLLHWAEQTAQNLDLGVEIPVDEDFMLLFPIVEADDLRAGLREQQEDVKQLASKWVNLPSAQVASKLKCFEKEAELANLTYPRLTPYLCARLADSVENPLEWFESFEGSGLSYDLTMCFQKRCLQEKRGNS